MAKALTLNGKPLSFTDPAPRTEHLLGLLRKLPANELFTCEELAKRAGMSSHAVQQRGPSLRDFSHIIGRRRLYGSAKTIAELRRQLKAQA